MAQGSLTPPGAPAPTMKTLHQIEPRTPIGLLPFTVSNPGSFYLAANLTGAAGTNGITITTNDVTLDLNGFTLTGAGSNNGVDIVGKRLNVVVRNGAIRNWSICLKLLRASAVALKDCCFPTERIPTWWPGTTAWWNPAGPSRAVLESGSTPVARAGTVRSRPCHRY